MTHTTEQERAEFEAWLIKHMPHATLESDGEGYASPWAQAAWTGWQAALCAQVVPKSWKLVPEEPTLGMQQAALKHVSKQYQTRDVYAAMLAAAPQPPEK